MPKNEFLPIEQLNEDDLVQEINRLTKMSKIRVLTVEESTYRESLRERFIKNFKEGLRSRLKMVDVVDSNRPNDAPLKNKEENKKD